MSSPIAPPPPEAAAVPPGSGVPGGSLTEGSRRPARRLGLLAALVLIVVVAAAALYWILAVYDSGPRVGADSIAEIQVAGGGWSPVDVDGAAGTEVTEFLAALEAARALWPPRLLFE